MQNQWKMPAGIKLRTLTILTLLFMGWLGSASAVSAQGYTAVVIGALTCDRPNSCWNEIGAQFSVTTEDGEFLGSCAAVGERDLSSNVEGCLIEFPFAATGILIVTEDVGTITPGYAPEENPIFVDTNAHSYLRPSHDAVFRNVPTGGNIAAAQTSDIAIVTTGNGQSVFEACYVLVDFSDVGCDDNGDGKITFWNVPLGYYVVRQVADLGPGRYVSDFEISIVGAPDSSGFERFFATVTSSSGAASVASSSSGTGSSTAAGALDISLITREPTYGNLLVGACYQLLDYSNIGCDENGDGQVDFAAIPAGTYTVRQTQTPAGYPTIYDFDIVVGNQYGVPLGYVVNQAREQHTPDTRNVSVVLIDSATSTKVHSSICVQFVGGSDAACDDNNGDGQIDFQGVSLGSYPAKFTGVPSGWQVMTGGGAPTFTVSAGTGPQFIFVEISVPGSANAGTNPGGSYAGADAGAIAVTGGTASATSNQTGVPASSFAPSGTTVEIILDTSDSMNEQDQGSQTRIEVAKTVATRLVTETLPAGVPMALRTYAGCTSSLTIPMQPLDPNSASSTIARLRADDKTPIAQSLRAAGNDLANVSGQKIIVLITDGDETCNGDPKAAIEALVAQDVNVQVNIVGFAIDDASLTATFQDWARAGNGTYYPASNELELHQAVTTASQLSFHVIDQNGSTIANGSVGGSPVAVPPGTYTVEIGTAPVTRYVNILVAAQQTVTLDLDTGGSAGSTTGIAPASASSESSASAGSSARTWTAAVWVRLCDAAPNSGVDIHCQGGAGIVVNFSLASGEFLGSCTTGDPYLTPWGPDTVADCSVDGMPFNADIVAVQDPSTIPTGYAPYGETSVVHIGNDPMPFQDGPPFSLLNVRADSSASGSSGISNSSNSGSATLLLTFRGCPEGFDPATDDPYANCTIPLDAPDASQILWGGDGMGGMNITGLDRQYDGAYIYNAGPATMNVHLGRLAPVVRDAYQVVGADSVNGDSYIINLHDGETREVLIFYYFY